jgi:ribosomal protein L16 Arg81 hydroxylase
MTSFTTPGIPTPAQTIANNLPNDEQATGKGTRRLYEERDARKIQPDTLPIADALIADDQRHYVTFDSFFGNVMFHEVAHGLGIKNTLDGSSTVRQALMEHASTLEEGKADILGLYMVQKLRQMGEITDGELMDNYVSFMAGIFRSVRFGASNAHGQANTICFTF